MLAEISNTGMTGNQFFKWALYPLIIEKYFSSIRLYQAGNYFQQGGFARTCFPGYGQFLCRLLGEMNILKDIVSPLLFRDPIYR